MVDINEMKKIAIDILKKDKYHTPMLFMCTHNNEIVPFMLRWENDLEKQMTFNNIRAMIKTHAKSYIMINDAAMRTVDIKHSEYVKNNPETEQPLCYPENMRSECLIIQKCTIEGKTELHIVEYKFNESRDVEIISDRDFSDVDMEGGIINFFK